MATGLHEPAEAAASAIAIWTAQDRQRAFIACPIFEILFGGARGGGKTDACLGDFLEHADTHGASAVGLMVRRRRTELVETIERSRQIYAPLGWTYNETKSMWTARNGARLRFAFLERDADADMYQGHSYTRLYVEEITNFPDPKPILKLMATLRSGAGVPVGFRATGNPGGAGHHWVRARYIDPAPQGGQIITDDNGLQRVFIPSKVGDNRYLGAAYIQQLKASGSPELVRAWLDGDWTVVQGAFFSEWTADVIVTPFDIPNEWTRFRSADWGFATPFSINWWAVVGDDYQIADGRVLSRGTLVCYREWYGASAPNVGLRLTAEEVAAGTRQREANDHIKYGVLDPSAFAESGGPSIAERLARAGVRFRRADNKRVSQLGAIGGWDQMRSRLKSGRLVFFSTCTEAIRTIPMLQHDPDKPEDLDTEAEDHAADSVRYACMSRPYVSLTEPARPGKMIETPNGLKFVEDPPTNEITMDMLWEHHAEEQGNADRRI